MADRDLARAGVPVDFFGEPTRMPAGPAKLAIETGAALLPDALLVRQTDGWGHATSIPALDTSSGDVAADTQALADLFAAGIAAHPADWHMLQPLWLADLPEERRAEDRGRHLMRSGWSARTRSTSPAACRPTCCSWPR